MPPEKRPLPASVRDQLVFHGHHAPRLRADADHVLTVRQVLTLRDTATSDTSVSLRFRVSGPQLGLQPGSVVSSFPPDLSAGAFDTVLPHVTLARGTLPWERCPVAGGDTPLPWLVLLVLTQAEMVGAKLSSLSASDLPVVTGIARGDTPAEANLTLLDLEAVFAARTLPPLGDLPWLAHVREVASASGATSDEPRETATILSARLPTPGQRHYAFLLSVEHRYSNKGLLLPVDALRLVFPVLHQWSFTVEALPRHGFAELLTQRDSGTPEAPIRIEPRPFAIPDAPAEAAVQSAAGMVAMRHMLRNGDISAAWYHGPLLPGDPPYSADHIRDRLPADHADDLMLLDRDFGMFDISYAAAWELGRMIALEHTDIAMALQAWKRGLARDDHRAATAPAFRALRAATLKGADQNLPDRLADWIGSALIELREVPFINLVPDEAMLPEGELRFFDIDPGWIEALRDGALAVGRTDSRAREIDHVHRQNLPPPPVMSGFLLRNGAVVDFPGLEVDGYADDAPDIGAFDRPALPILRMERLSASVLMVLFRGRVQTVDLHLHPQALHFGFERHTVSGRVTFVKDVKLPSLAGKATITPGNGMQENRRIDMAYLAQMFEPDKTDAAAVARVAVRMIEPVPLVRFTRDVRGVT